MQVTSRDNTIDPGATRLKSKAIPRAVRMLIAAVGLTLLGLLVVARTLQPSPEGRGTHRQLLLPPCGFLTVIGKPCPSCGMTTSWSHLTRGQLAESIQCNAGGFLLGIVALVGGAWLVTCAWIGRWLGIEPTPQILVVVASVILLVTFTQWLMKLWA